MKILTVVGARPQFIKSAPVSKALRSANYTEFLVHTGQHYDYAMSQIFFDEMGLPRPDINLNTGSGLHGQQTGQMLIEIEKVLLKERPDWVLVYGDTNSTLAGALAAIKLQVPVAHVEAGLRSFNRAMPEEYNRILTDHSATLLFCPTSNAVDLLANEGIIQGVHLVGDTMYDAVLQFGEIARKHSRILQVLELKPKQYYLATIHRPYNTDVPAKLNEILTAFSRLDHPVIFPLHPRTRQKAIESGVNLQALSNSKIEIVDPVGYLDMLVLEENAYTILTDSGGIQKEAYFLSVPCVTLRPETEWVETVAAGWNRLTAIEAEQIVTAVKTQIVPASHPNLYGNGQAADHIVNILRQQ